MSQPLLLLLRLQIKGWFRTLTRSLSSVKGALLLLVGLLLFGGWLFAVFFTPRQPVTDVEPLRRYGPAGLLAYCFIAVLLSKGERAIYFSPGEVNFLFAGPFSRRQLLIYKMTTSALIGGLVALLFTTFFRHYTRWFFAGYVGIYVALIFMQSFSMLIQMVAVTIGTQACTRGRKVIIGLIVVGIVALMLQDGMFQGERGVAGLARQLESSPVWRTISSPLRCYVNAFLAEKGDWKTLGINAGLALLLNVGVIIVVVAMDAKYLEAAAVTSERIYNRIQRMRRGDGGGLSWRSTNSDAGFGLPALPRWGGIGPVAWQKLTTAMRGWTRLLFIAGVFFIIVLMPQLVRRGPAENGSAELLQVMTFMFVWTALFITSMLPFDFRGDLDRMEVLKTLPIVPWRMALGQLLTPVLIVTFAQLLIMGVLVISTGQWHSYVIIGACFALPVSFLVLALDNLIFLWFPTRLTAVQPGDLQAMGRNVLFMLLKLITLGAIIGLAIGVGALVYYLLGKVRWLSFGSAWIVVVASGLALIPLIASAFNRLDVARDLPRE